MRSNKALQTDKGKLSYNGHVIRFNVTFRQLRTI
jgi:hypothetical protein